jgi:ATP-dependent DNA ligase
MVDELVDLLMSKLAISTADVGYFYGEVAERMRQGEGPASKRASHRPPSGKPLGSSTRASRPWPTSLPSDWIHEIKLDRYRMIVRKTTDRVRLFTRTNFP